MKTYNSNNNNNNSNNTNSNDDKNNDNNNNNNYNNNNNKNNNNNNGNFVIFKQYYICNYTPHYQKVVYNWLVCYQNLTLTTKYNKRK